MLVKVGGLQFKEVNRDELFFETDERRDIVETTSNYIGKNRRGHYTYSRAGTVKMFGVVRNNILANAIRQFNNEKYNTNELMIVVDSGSHIFGKESGNQSKYNMKSLYYEEGNLSLVNVPIYTNHFGNRGNSVLCMGSVRPTTTADPIQEVDSIARTFFVSPFNDDLNVLTVSSSSGYRSELRKIREAYDEVKEERAQELGIDVELLNQEVSRIIYSLENEFDKTNMIRFCVVTGIDYNFFVVLLGSILDIDFTLRY